MGQSGTPSENDVLGYMQELSNWGKWGPQDELGTLNYITPSKRISAAREVTAGRCLSLAHDLNDRVQPNNPRPILHMMLYGGGSDYLGIACHGLATTHIDAFCHMNWQGKTYNGRPTSDIRSDGAHSNSVLPWCDGIVTRGVLLDVASARGVPWLDVGDPVRAADLEAAETFGDTKVEEGDIPIVRIGQWPRMEKSGWERSDISSPNHPGRGGLHADCLPWLHERRAAAYGGDCVEHYPSGYPQMFAPLHTIGLVAMGLPLLDNISVEPLAKACRELQKYSFQFVAAPLRIPRGTGSPINPVAIL
jgi:kynurenine formamidase